MTTGEAFADYLRCEGEIGCAETAFYYARLRMGQPICLERPEVCMKSRGEEPMRTLQNGRRRRNKVKGGGRRTRTCGDGRGRGGAQRWIRTRA